MEVLTVLTGSLLPARDGALIEAEGRDDGLRGTAVSERGGNDGKQQISLRFCLDIAEE
jgi:hypothetical protein